MITRKLLAAVVGLSLAGTLGTASAQTKAPMPIQSASPSDTMTPATVAKSNATMTKAPMRKHHARMSSKTHRNHVAQRATKLIATKHTAFKHLVSKPTGVKAAETSKRTRISHLVKRGTIKHV